MRGLWRRLQWFAHRDAFEQELDEELRHHLAMKAQEQGSVRAAQRQVGNVTFWKESSRMMWSGVFLEQFAQDVRYSLRSMKANKLFTLMAMLSLALGIGANTAIYSFMDAILIRALPVKQPERLVILNWRVKAQRPGVIESHWGSSFRDSDGNQVSPNYPWHAYESLRDNNHSLSPLFAYASAGRLNAVVDGQAVLGDSELVSGGYFSGLGVPAAIGRLISFTDDQPNAMPALAISYRFWQSHFGGSATAVGKPIVLNGSPFTVIGVTPPEFFGVKPSPTVPDFFIPVRQSLLVLHRFRDAGAFFTDDHSYWIESMGRLKPGVTLSHAQTELQTLFQHWVSATARNEHDRTTLPKLWLEEGGSGVDSLRREYSKPLFVLMAMVGLILTIACANIANLLLSRAASRRREIAVRLSLGAGRLRVIRQLLTESILLALGGGVLGIVIAAVGIRFLTALLGNGDENFTLNAELDWRVLLFSLGIALVTGLLFGLAPAIQATRVDVSPALKETRASNAQGRMRRFGVPFGLRHVLIVSQIAISMLLVAGAGLFVRTLNNLNSVDVGFNQDNILLFSLDGAQAGYQGQTLANLYAELQRRFRLIPGVRNVTLTDMPLVSNWVNTTNISIPGFSKKVDEGTSVTGVGPRFFETMEIPVLEGRAIDERDQAGAPVVVVVNQVFAKKYFPGVSPVGRRFRLGGDKTGVDVEVVGLAKTTRYSSLKDEIPAVTYVSYAQAVTYGGLRQMFFELRTSKNPLSLTNAVREIVHQMTPRVPVADVRTQTQSINATITQERTFAALCTCFGILALVMACVGLYATTAYAVVRRTNEIGIRMALGAMKSRIIWMVVSEVLILAAVGLAIGSTAIWEITAFVQSFLFGLQPHDPVTFTAAAIILMACSAAAGFAPAWRASKIDPMVALRHE